jgi:alkaline phosphatase
VNTVKNICCRLLALVLIPWCISCAVTATPAARPRSVILLIGDGMGFAQIKAYRYYADDPSTPSIDPLPFDRYLVATVATESIVFDCAEDDAASCVQDPYGITDSAAAASAYATGQDTEIGHLGLSPSGEIQPDIAEMARRQGKSVGLAVTSQITHATPAAFVSHVEGRHESAAIADQLFDNQWNKQPLSAVLLGGGTADMQRADRNLAAEFGQAGYTLVSNREELMQTDSSRILGLFAPWGLARAWDRDVSVPSLAEMIRAALKALAQNPDGFFLMVEGSQIDWAAHANDIAGVISEMEDFSAAAEVALEFAAERGDTLVVITADHETGGMSLGRDDNYRWNPRPLRGLQRTPAAMTEEFLAGSEALSLVVSRSIPFTLTAQEQISLDAFEREVPADPAYGVDGVAAYEGINQLLSQRSLTGWSTTGHTGVDVPLYAVGPGSENFHGLMQNEEVGRLLQTSFLFNPNIR